MLTQRKQNILILLLCSILILGSSCKENKQRKSLSSQVTLKPIAIDRFEQAVFEIDQKNLSQAKSAMAQKYGTFYDIYFGRIMNFGDPKNPNFDFILKDFINHPDLKILYQDVKKAYPDTKKISEDLAPLLANYHILYPNDSIPKVATFISGFNNAIVTTPDYIGIGLDMFMGKNYQFYASVDFPAYITNRLSKEHITPAIAKALLNAKLPEANQSSTLLSEMIQEGKILYGIDLLLPDAEDSLKIGYTAEQLTWCKANEGNIYKLFIEDNLLFSAEQKKYAKYLEEAPFTSGLANNSAPRIGIWCGWQIVKNYMNNNPSVSFDELWKEKDAQKILKLATYKPKNI
jgi:hypothetical protein